ncbi:histidine kinase [Lachnospiraceae bacterium]|uniref:cache domain-containing sensor histidine kinase n=1 Tax=Extibacter sp. GGCC_0201 TaxID=2731209 RepID=UPI001AA161D2|nr:sensor histidine kinase [Extibacter sp. GGCC_0201]BDF34709.1 histidine kinase [Lachnospiraceae bacterium]BDF38711.1 histidine kinase [Lachnospiraceae bacterium]
MKDKYFRRLNKVKPREIQSTIMIAFSLISLSLMMVLGIVMYIRFSNLSRQETVQSTQKLMEQTGENLEDYLVSMRQISDAAYYNVIKENDFASQDQDIQTKMNLLYEANRDNLRSIAIYNNHGSLRMAEPVAAQKEDPDVTRQDWYKQAMEEMENVHFSTPHIQNLFDDGTFRYYWVISLSRVVELTGNGVSQMGVLLVDMDYSSISRMMKQINTLNTEQYYYLCDSSGQIIYHPRQIQISDGIYNENSKAAAGYKDGVYDERFEGESRKVVVNTISYTGWKLVGVIPNATFTHGTVSIRYFIAILVLLMAMMLVVINRVVSVRISSPILKLDDSVKGYEAGETPEIYIGGSLEIRHLGHSIQRSYEQIDTLMKKIVLEQNERRKSELDALQSQINPHFLYNTLESIVWMVEGERNNEAVFMLSQLAKLFRISLSKGSTVITVKDELQHAQSYMNIQKIRYKNTFSISFHVDPAIYGYCTVKLILQPILENAINYGVSGMDDCGEITVTGRLEGSDLILAVTDNGMGMTREEAELVLTDSERVHKHGSGVGLVNVNNRIQILFGKEYGLAIESEPDEGTTVFIRLPAVLYTEENKKVLEQGHIFSMEEMNDREIGDEE